MVTEMRRIASLVVLCALLMTGFASLPAPVLADGHGSNYPYPGTGDWNITGYTYVGNETVVLNGNLNIKASGSLYLNNVTISINNPSNGKYGVNISSGGKLTAIGSTFKGPMMPPPFNYTFYSDVGSNVTLSKCTFENAGYNHKDMTKQGVAIGSLNPSISDTTFRKGYSGLILMGSKNVTLSSLRFENNTQIGLFQIQTENIVVEDSNATGNMAGFAMYVSKSATLRRSESNTNVFGAMLIGAQKTRVNSFKVYNAYLGVVSETSGNSTIGPFVNVTYSQNGVFLNSSRDSNVIDNNIVSATDGIYLNNSLSNKVLMNTVKSSLDKGIVLMKSSKNEIGRNTILSTAGASKIVGIDLEDSSNNQVHNNTILKTVATNEDAKGVYLLRSNNNTLFLNRIEGLSALRYSYGIVAQESSYNYMAKNIVINVSASSPTGNIFFPWYSIGVIAWEKSNRNTIAENTVTNVTTLATYSYSLGI